MPAAGPARRRRRSPRTVDRLGARDRARSSRRRRARRRAEGRAALRRRPRARDPRRPGRGRLHLDLALRARLRPGQDPARPRHRHRRPRRRARRGHRRHRPHARVSHRPARRRAARGGSSTCTLLDRPTRRIVPHDLRYRGVELDDEFVLGYGLHVRDLYRNLPFVVGRGPRRASRRPPDALRRRSCTGAGKARRGGRW